MKTFLWMIVGTTLSFLALSNLGIIMAKSYTNMSDGLWFWKMMAVYSFCGILTSPIPYVIGSSGLERKNNLFRRVGLRASLIFGGLCLSVFILSILKGGGLW